MKLETYRFYMRIISIAILLIVVVSVILELYFLLIAVILIAVISANVLRRRVSDMIQDERTFRISEIASRRTVQIVGMITGMGGVILIALSQVGFEELEQIGSAMAIFASAIIFCYLMLFVYYSKKLGGV